MYFVKRRKIQKKIKTGKKRKKLLEKYGKREKNRINDLYHKMANRIVDIAEKILRYCIRKPEGYEKIDQIFKRDERESPRAEF